MNADQIVVLDEGRDRRHGHATTSSSRPARPTARSSSPSSPRRRRRRHERTARHGWRSARRAAAGRRRRRGRPGRRPEPLAGRHDGHARREAQGLPRRASCGCWAVCGPRRRIVVVVIVPGRRERDRRRSSGPRILGNATDIIFDGVIGKKLPAGVTQAQVEAGLRAQGQGQIADLLSGMTVTPGVGIDFGALGPDPAHPGRHLPVSALFAWGQAYMMAGVDPADRLPAAARRRREARAPAAQVLRQPSPRRHPEPRHQRHRQHRPDAPAEPHAAHHVGPDGHRRADHDARASARCWRSSRCSPCRVGHRATAVIAKRSQKQFAAQWKHHRRAQRARRGDAHRPRHRDQSSAARRRRWRRSRSRTSSSTRRATGPSSSRGIIQPAMNFIANLNYVGDRRHRRPAGRLRAR